MSNQEYLHMLEYLKEVQERLEACEDEIHSAKNAVGCIERRISEFKLPQPDWDENEDADNESED
jgi:chromosome segregation ATPase